MLIGITGMPGSGKSKFADLLNCHSGVRIDLDQMGHKVLQMPQVKEKIQSAFGAEVFEADGQISRFKLGKRVFGMKQIEQLNAICHPEIRKNLVKTIKFPLSFGSYYIQDAALIFEAGFDDLCDFVIFIKSSFETRLKRVQKSRNWSEKELRNRDAAQNELLKAERSDLIISNESNLCSLESLACQLDIAFRYHLATGIQLSQIERFQGNHS
jgi:dephospho-CoA kinase